MYKMFIFYFLVMVMYNFSAPILPEMLIDKEVFAGLNSFLIAAFSIAMFLTSPKASKYIDTNGLKKIMMFMPLLMALGQFVMFLAPGSIGLIFGRALTGFFGAFFFMSGSIYVNHFSEPSKKATNFAYLMVASSLGGVVGQIFIGTLSPYFEGYAYAFILQMIFAVLLIGLATIMIKEIKINPTNKNEKKEKFRITPLLLMVTLLAASTIIYSGNIGYYFMDQLNASTNQVALVNCLYLIIILIANLFIVKIVEKFLSMNTLFFIQIIGAIIGMSLLSISIYFSIPVLIFVSLVIFIFSLSIFLPLSQKLVVSKNAENSNVELGFINSTYTLGMVIGSILGGIVYMIEPNMIFIIIIFMLIGALFTHIKEVNKTKQVNV